MLVQHVSDAQLPVNLTGWERPPLFAGSPYLNKVSDTPFCCLPDDAELLIVMDDNKSFCTTVSDVRDALEGKHQDVRAIYKRPNVALIRREVVKKTVTMRNVNSS